MNMIKGLVRVILRFVDKLQKSHIGAYAAQAAYYTVLSGIPLLMLLLSVIQYTPLTKSILLKMLASFVPTVVMPFIVTITEEVYTKSMALVSVTAVVTLWSASRGILSITTGFNNIYNVTETRNYFIMWIKSAFYTMFMLVAVVVAMLLIVFSEQRLEFLGNKFPIVEIVVSELGWMRYLLIFLVETLVFMLLYKWLPNRKTHIVWQIPGSVLSAFGWSAFSYLFSAYVDRFSSMSYIYGSLTAVVLFMLWIFSCMYILFIGAGINSVVEQYPNWRKWKKYMKNQQYLDEQ